MLVFDQVSDCISSGVKLKSFGPPSIEIVNFIFSGITSESIERFIEPSSELLHVSSFIFKLNTFWGIGFGSQTSPI